MAHCSQTMMNRSFKTKKIYISVLGKLWVRVHQGLHSSLTSYTCFLIHLSPAFIKRSSQPCSRQLGPQTCHHIKYNTFVRLLCVLECTLDLRSCPPIQDNPGIQDFWLSDTWLEKLGPSIRNSRNVCPVFRPLTSWLGKPLPYILGFFTIHGKSRSVNGFSVCYGRFWCSEKWLLLSFLNQPQWQQKLIDKRKFSKMFFWSREAGKGIMEGVRKMFMPVISMRFNISAFRNIFRKQGSTWNVSPLFWLILKLSSHATWGTGLSTQHVPVWYVISQGRPRVGHSSTTFPVSSSSPSTTSLNHESHWAPALRPQDWGGKTCWLQGDLGQPVPHTPDCPLPLQPVSPSWWQLSSSCSRTARLPTLWGALSTGSATSPSASSSPSCRYQFRGRWREQT